MGNYIGKMEKAMETTIVFWDYDIIGVLLGLYWAYMGGCQNDGPFLGPYYTTAPNIKGIRKGTIILTTTHIGIMEKKRKPLYSRVCIRVVMENQMDKNMEDQWKLGLHAG